MAVPEHNPTSPVVPPRKKRRRTAAGGAADDCFACRKRAIACDRKRPYCSQCIDVGKDCSGYKTTLTWGVGVASRGKLRGLSCPVANSSACPETSSPPSLSTPAAPSASLSTIAASHDAAPSAHPAGTATDTRLRASQLDTRRTSSLSSAAASASGHCVRKGSIHRRRKSSVASLIKEEPRATGSLCDIPASPATIALSSSSTAVPASAIAPSALSPTAPAPSAFAQSPPSALSTGAPSAAGLPYQPTPPLAIPPIGQSQWQLPGFHERPRSPHSDIKPSHAPAHPLPMSSPPLPLPPFSSYPSLTPLQRLRTSLGTAHDPYAGLPASGSSIGSFPDPEYHSAVEYPQTPGSCTFSDPFPPSVSGASYATHPLSSSIDSLSLHSLSTEPFPDIMCSSLDSLHGSARPVSDSFSNFGAANDPAYDQLPYRHQSSLPVPVPHEQISPNMLQHELAFANLSQTPPVPFSSHELQTYDESISNMRVIEEEDDEDEHQEFIGQICEPESKRNIIFDTRFGSSYLVFPPHVQPMMEYYDRFVCPYLVTFDGPENPYRKHILSLAIRNTGLQNAIAALAVNNDRMRRLPGLQRTSTGFVQEIADAFNGSPAELSDRGGNAPSAAEINHKRLSIDQLNCQLADTRAAQDDSVLATLLILCLFHVSDSGFSKFKTQLAGVQKLLSLRNSSSGPSEFTGWVEMFFVWFDVMTSTVNDREMQVTGDTVDILDPSSNCGALEQYSGCDGRLFKLIARLGRLNLLSQRRSVRPQRSSRMQAPPPPPSSFPLATDVSQWQSAASTQLLNWGPTFRATARDAKPSMMATDYDCLDGNGWCSSMGGLDDELDIPSGGCDDYTFVKTENVETVSPIASNGALGVDFPLESFMCDNETTSDLQHLDDRVEFWAEWTDIRERLQAWRMDVPCFNGADEQVLRDLQHINESFRASALLYTERLGYPHVSSAASNIQQYVSRALVHIAALPVDSCVNKFLLWPLFVTGAECVDEAHRALIRDRCIEVQRESGFYNNLSSLAVLERVWRADAESFCSPVSSAAASAQSWFSARDLPSPCCQPQGLKWRQAMDRSDGEYLVI